MTSLRKIRLAAGLCWRCGNPPKPGLKQCSRCLAYATSASSKCQKQKRSLGLCGCGNRRAPNSSLCQRCKDSKIRSWKTKKLALEESGTCLSCGRNPARAGKKTCAECSQRRVQHSRKSLGISNEAYAAKALEQNGVCAICGIAPSVLCVDHNHSTGQVRDLLCHRCNRVLGLCGESSPLFASLAAYIEKWTEK